MLLLLVLLPILAFLAILLGAPARLTAIAASAVNLVLGLAAVFSWKSTVWSFSAPVLEKPALNLAFAFTDGMSVIMVLLSVIVTLAAVLSGKSPVGREKLYFGSSLLISAGALGAFAAIVAFFDEFIINGLLVSGLSRTAESSGNLFRKVQSGSLQGYAFAFGLGVLLVVYFTTF